MIPTLITEPSLASSCDSAKVDAYVRQLPNYLQEKQFEALAKCSTSAVPALIEALKDNNQEVRWGAAYTLGLIGSESRSAIQPLIQALLDANNNPDVRSTVADTLGFIKSQDKEVISALLEALKKDSSADVRESAAYSLGLNRATHKDVVLELIKVLDSSDEDAVRKFAAQSLGQIAEQDRSSVQPFAPPTLIKVIQDQSQDISVRVDSAYALGAMRETSDSAITTLIGAFKSQNSELRNPSALALVRIAEFLQNQANTRQEIENVLPIVAKIQAALGEPEQNTDPEVRQPQESVKSALQSLQTKQKALLNGQIISWLTSGRTVWLTHATFWLLLIFVYPKCPSVQAIFFWNPWVRKIFGLGYVSFCLTWVPFLRRRLFEPFQTPFLMDARLESFNPEAYFPDAEVECENQALSESEGRIAIAKAIPHIKGQIVLEGKSGLGKSMFLRHLLKPSARGKLPKQVVVYLLAAKCADGVIEAIQKKLHGDEIKDAKFLESLIYSGAIDICIDGLNEASADTRAKITQFVESYFKGNILMTTQQLGQTWKPPANAKTFVMQPLQPDQIEAYLLSRQPFLPEKAPIQGAAYEQACYKFLAESLGGQVDLAIAEREKAQIVLSNPLELSLAALMLASGNPVDLRNLREQQYKYMAEDYRETWNREFPIQAFSDAVYQLWLDEKTRRTLPADDFPNEVVCMADEKFRMAVSRRWEGKEGDRQEWSFRHDKIAEFFIAQTFRDGSEEARSRLAKHIGDSSFSGVYLLLATLLPTDAAYHLREDLIQYAAKTGDHTVSDTYVQIVPCR
jgi:HEAT repeats